MQFYPLKFRPIYKQRIWGGQRLREFFNKDIPVFERIGESWELADLPEDKSIIANGELAGKTISQVIAKYPEQITGSRNFLGRFPLLIKFINAEDVLSIQVHPDEQTCLRMGKGEAKSLPLSHGSSDRYPSSCLCLWTDQACRSLPRRMLSCYGMKIQSQSPGYSRASILAAPCQAPGARMG